MQLQDFFNSESALRMGLWLGQHTPPRVGYRLADAVTGVVARRHESPLVRSVHSNLRVVLGPQASDEQVARTAREVFRHAGRVYFNFYHHINLGMERLVRTVTFSPRTEQYIEEVLSGDRGALIVGCHLSAYELAGVAFAYRGIPIQGLSWADPTSGYRLQNQLRTVQNFEYTPISSQALRQAVRRLRGGGYVATAVDRPDPFGGGIMLPFFGRTARMPDGHVRLALQTNVPVLVAAAEYRPSDNTYMMHLIRRLEMERVGSKEEDIVHNTRRILAILEGVIGSHPEQWLMFYPVWEEELAAKPGEATSSETPP